MWVDVCVFVISRRRWRGEAVDDDLKTRIPHNDLTTRTKMMMMVILITMMMMMMWMMMMMMMLTMIMDDG